MKVLSLSALLLTLGGCATLEQPRFYTLDLNTTRLCRGDSGACQNLELIGPSYYESEIARAYGIRTTARNWSVADLAGLMLSPPDNLYQVQQVEQGVYRLPANRATDTVFRYLELEEELLYGSGAKPND